MAFTLTGVALATALLAGGTPSSPLKAYAGHARVLVVSAASSSDPEFRRQEAALRGSRAALSERQVVIIRIAGSIAHDEAGATMEAAGLRTALGLPAASFGVVLVGKDGGVKLRRRGAVLIAELTGIIDSMPMRRLEMGRDAAE